MLDVIQRIRRRRRLVEGAVLALSAGAFLLALIAAAVAIDWRLGWTHPILRWIPPLIALAAVGAALLALSRQLLARRRLRDEAREVDRNIPALEERWCTVTELSGARRDPALNGSPELIRKVIEEAASMQNQVRLEAIVPARTLRWPAMFCGAAVVLFGISGFSVGGHLGTLLARFFEPWRAISLTRVETPSAPQQIPRASPYEIRAELAGRVPTVATLLLRDPSGAIRSVSLPVQKTADVTAVSHRMPQVDEPFSYQIRAGDAETPWVQVQPVDRPKLGQFAVRIVWPAYTKRPATTWDKLPASAHALRGSQFQMEFSADQPLTLAALEIAREPKAERLPLESTGSQRYRFATELQKAFQFQILAENAFGLRNATAECRIEVDEDQPPEVRILESSQQVALTAEETLHIDFEAKDDFGVEAAEIVATTRKEGEEPRETIIPIELGAKAGDTAMKKSVELDLSRLGLDAKTQLSYAIRVRDNRNEAMSAQPSENAAQKPGENTTAQKSSPQESPENPMTKRTLDLACQSCSSPKEVRIEKFSGSYDGTARRKKSIAIDAVLQALRKATTDALARTEGAAASLSEAAALDTPRTAWVHAGLAHVQDGKRHAENLKKESAGTPYAFFAVQTDGLVKGGLDPAAEKLRGALAGKPARENLDAAAVSLRWVLSTLDGLTKQYTSLKEVQKAEDLLQEIKEMHLVFLEDMPKWLKAGAPSSPYSRRMLEVDAAFAKAYEEFLRKRRDIYMQLAELLAKHPELQARFLDASKTSTTLYRDELMKLKGEQAALQVLTDAAEKGPKNESTSEALWAARLQKLRTQAATQATQFAKTAATWMPAEYAPDLRAELETSASEMAASVWRASGPGAAAPEVAQAISKVDAFEDAVAKAGNVHGKNSAFVRNRFEDIDKLRAALEQTSRLALLMEGKKVPEALHASQAQLNSQTSALATRIQQESISLIGLGPEVREAVSKFDDQFKHDVLTPQGHAAEALRAKSLRPATQSQGSAAAGLENAVVALDDFIQKAIRRMDEASAKRAVGGSPTPPTLEALLKSLEEEKREAMSLGISCQPLNIQVQTDWQQPGGNQAAAAAMQQKRGESARESASAAAREAARAQEQANKRAKELSRQLETALVSKTAQGMAKGDKNADWNTVPSELRASLLQERGQPPPKRYENAIRQYFKSIAETPAQGSAPAAP
jgi:hypothetical protein